MIPEVFIQLTNAIAMAVDVGRFSLILMD